MTTHPTPEALADVSVSNLKAILASGSPTATANALRNSIKAIEALHAELATERALSFRDQVAQLEAERDSLRAEVERLTPKWLPIETAPKDGVSVLVIRISDILSPSTAYFSRGHWRWSTSGGYAGNPTHWMPLPQPPAP